MLELWQKGEETCVEGVRKRNETEFMYDDSDDNDGDDKIDDNPIDTVDIASEVKVENNNSCPKRLSPNGSDATEISNDLNDNDHKCNPLKNIKMLEQIKKWGRPERAKVTVVGLPKKKVKTNGNFLPFAKLSLFEKTVQLLNIEY